MADFDTLISNGHIIDGTGEKRFLSNLIISLFHPSKKQISIRNKNYLIKDLRFKRKIDAQFHIIAPGFIDVHTHDDQNVFDDPSMSCKISQGVTTCILGNCGISLAPFNFSGNVPAPIPLLGKKEVFT